jgi:dihydrofolate synthase/folylpolyglutamate synthase
MDRSAPPALLKEYAEQWCKNTACIEEVKDAVASALSQASKDDLILITGSLFTVGEAREFLDKKTRRATT